LADSARAAHGWSVFRDGCATMWFLREITSQYVVRVPLKLGVEFYAVVDQGWLEKVVRRGVFDISRVCAQRLRVVYSHGPMVSLFLGVGLIISVLV